MAYLMTIQPYALFGKTSSNANYWKNPDRVWDGDITTAPSGADNSYGAYLTLDMSWLPANMKITAVTYGLTYKRRGNNAQTSLPRMHLSYSSKTTYSSMYITSFPTAIMPAGSYDVTQTVEKRYVLEEGESDAFLNAAVQLLYLSTNTSNTPYEVYLIFEYEEKGNSNIYVGEQNASAVYVGETRAQAVYIGTTKVL